VIVDRISHEIPFYRAYLKHAAIHGVAILNNPFSLPAGDNFFNGALAAKLGVAIPPAVILPHKQYPAGTTEQSMRNLEYPLDWEGVFASVGEHGFLKPVDGFGSNAVFHVRNREEFFQAYDQSGDRCMMYQKAFEDAEYLRCHVVGKKVRLVSYDPRKPLDERYSQTPATDPKLLKHIEQDALAISRALGFDINAVDFAVAEGVPYVVALTNPAPEADLDVIGQETFDWLVGAVADLAVATARKSPQLPESRWSALLVAEAAPAKVEKVAEPEKSKPAAKKAAAKKSAKAANRTKKGKK
jgi:hypothetical protein